MLEVARRRSWSQVYGDGQAFLCVVNQANHGTDAICQGLALTLTLHHLASQQPPPRLAWNTFTATEPYKVVEYGVGAISHIAV